MTEYHFQRSVENIEKAYSQYRAEQLEKVAYDKLNSTFANRFAGEQKVRVSNVEKQNYDAKTEVATLRHEFAELRKSLTDQSDTIVKSQEFAIPEDVPSSIEQFVDMSWGDIHNIASKYGE